MTTPRYIGERSVDVEHDDFVGHVSLQAMTWFGTSALPSGSHLLAALQRKRHYGRGSGMNGIQQRQHDGQTPERHMQSMAELALRGTALLWDLQMETARNLWRTQARAAALLGIPDCSGLFDIDDDRARRLFTTGAEQLLNTARRTRETVVEMQRQFGRLAEQQTIGITEEVRDRIAQVGRHTEQGLQQIGQMTASEADEAEAHWHDVQNRGHEASRHRGGDASFHDEGTSPGRQATTALETENAASESKGAGESRTQRKPRRHEARPRARR
jgi:hypothetical protein